MTNDATNTNDAGTGEDVAAPFQRFVHPLVLSLFPGVGLLDRAFEAEGFCVVRGPDVLWGGDVREFHPPAGKFDGIIGGPPCQSFSSWKPIVNGSGADVSFGNLIPEFERCIREAKPTWFLMENVRAAPLPSVEGYATWSCLLNNRQCIEGDEPAKQSRERRWTFGDARTGQRTVLMIETAALHNPRFEYAATIGGGHRRDRPVQAKAMERNGMKSRKSAVAFAHFKRLQGLPDEWDLPPFKTEEKVRAVCNGVPLAMGRAMARAVRDAVYG